MEDRSANGEVRDGTSRGDFAQANAESGNAVPKYDPWVSFYGFLHRYVQRHTLVFGGSGVVGLLVVVRQLYGLAFASTRWPILPSWLLTSGVLSFAFGLGYYVIRDDSSCEECGAAFSKERIASQTVWQERTHSSWDRMYIRETFECRQCGDRTTEPYSYPEREYPRY